MRYKGGKNLQGEEAKNGSQLRPRLMEKKRKGRSRRPAAGREKRRKGKEVLRIRRLRRSDRDNNKRGGEKK